MFSSISSKSIASKQLASPFALSQTRKAAARQSIPVFGEEVTEAASTQRTSAKIAPRRNSVGVKTLPVPQLKAATTKANANTKAQTIVAKSLTNKALSTGSPVKSTSPVKAAAAEDGSVTTPPADPADAVRALLTELGYDASKFKFESREEYVSYPGGGYTHKYTAVELPNGTKENFTTDLMSRYPSVTANELRRLMENQHLTTQVTVQSFNGGA